MKLGFRALFLLVTSFLIASPPSSIGQGNGQTTASMTQVWIPEGTLIEAQLEKSLDANKAQVDDSLTLEVKTDVRNGTKGALLIPRHARLLARVSSVTVPSGKKGQAELSIEVLSVEWKGGFAKLDCRIVQADTATVQVPTITAPAYGAPECVVERGERGGTFTRCYPNLAPRRNLPQLPPALVFVVFVTDGKLVFPSSNHSLPAGTMFLLEHRVPSESTKAFESSRDAALKGEAEAQFRVGRMYHGGVGVAQNYAQAAEWYGKAAEQGHSRAQNNLGVLYAQGQGVPQDYATAYVWFSLASAAAQEETKAALQLLESMMTPAQIAEGKRRAEEWVKQHPASH